MGAIGFGPASASPKACAVAALFAAATPLCAAVTVHDVGAEWQDSSNPFGNWSVYYTDIFNNYQLVSLVPPTTRTSDSWTTTQKSFGDLPGIFKSNGTEEFAHDWLAGDVVVHSDSSIPIALVWTAPQATRVTITVGGWAARDIGRISHGTVVIEDENDVGVFSIDPLGFGADRAHASHYSYTTLAALAPGSQIIFGIRSDTTLGDYFGLEFVVRAIPEPSPAELFLVAALGLMTAKLCKRAIRCGW